MNEPQIGQEERQITRKQKELSNKAHILKERVAFLRNRLSPVLTKSPEEALAGTPTRFSGIGPTQSASLEGTAPLYEQLSCIAETIACATSEIEKILNNLEI